MNVIVFGATGMVGQGVLLECLDDASISSVLAVGRRPCGLTHPKLHDIVHHDFLDYSTIEDGLRGYDACFFCLGVSAAGMSEQDYHRLTFEVTLRAAETLVRLNPTMTFCYVSGTGTDSSERGRSMWARVKGKTENHLMRLPFKATYMFRPGYIQPLRGVRSGTRLYRAVYAVLGPLYPVLKTLAPNSVTTTVQVGRAMIRVARHGFSRQLLESRDINALAAMTPRSA
jgi:uncharacterized protein YbjT (DUF2867 family)